MHEPCIVDRPVRFLSRQLISLSCKHTDKHDFCTDEVIYNLLIVELWK